MNYLADFILFTECPQLLKIYRTAIISNETAMTK